MSAPDEPGAELVPAGQPHDAGVAALLLAAEPGKLFKGQFTVYKTPEGGLHIAYRLDGQEEDGHMPIPPALIKIALAAGTGKGPLAMLARFLP